MTSDNKFPLHPCLEEDGTISKSRHLFLEFFKNPRLVYVGSLHKEFIKEMVSVKCSDTTCNKPLIDEESSPMTGYCGHLFCSVCANVLFDTYNSNWAKLSGSNAIGGPVHGLKQEEKEVSFNWKYNDHLFYSCEHCGEVKARKEEEGADYLKLFSANRMVENLYKELKKDGFRCGHANVSVCGEWHPMYNSLLDRACYWRDKKFGHLCLTHANMHLLQESHEMEIMSPESEDSAYTAEKPPHGSRLSSVERTELHVIASFYHCAHCLKLLEVVNKDKNYALSKHLECGHFVGSECVNEVLEIAHNGHYVACIFCNEKFGKITAERHFMFPSKQLSDIIQKTPHTLVKCKRGECGGGRVHPRDTDVAEDCEWCAVEHNMWRLAYVNKEEKK